MARIIEESLLQAIVNYLASRPYNEVFQVVSLLQNLPKLPEPENKPE